MPRKKVDLAKLPDEVYRCPHCGYEHQIPEIRRVDFNNLRCKKCGKDFDAKAALILRPKS